MKLNDYSTVYQLWLMTSGMGLNDIDDSQQGIARILQRNPTLNFVVEDNEQVIGVIIAGEDGQRGYIYHMAVHQDYRQQGIGQDLLESVLDEMRVLLITKVGFFIFQDNHIGNSFWQKMGFAVRNDLHYRNCALTEFERIDT